MVDPGNYRCTATPAIFANGCRDNDANDDGGSAGDCSSAETLSLGERGS